MAIFVCNTKKPMGIAAYMDEWMRNVVLVGGCRAKNPRNSLKDAHGTLTSDSRAKTFLKVVNSHIAVISTQRRTEWYIREVSRTISSGKK